MNFKTFFLVGLMLSVSACGGGGGGDNSSSNGGSGGGGTASPAPSVAITTSNSDQVASTAGSGDSVAKSASGGYAPLTVNQSTQNALTVRSLATSIFHLGSSQNLQALATTPICGNADGSATVTGGLTGATSGSIIFNNCMLSGTSVVLDGTVTKTLKSGDTDTDTFDVTVTFTNFKVTLGTVTTLNATMHVVSNSDGTTLTVDVDFPNFYLTHGSDYVGLYDFTMHSDEIIATQAYTMTFSYTFDSDLINGAVKVATETPLQGYSYNNYPDTGSVVFTGANNAQIRVTANGDGTVTVAVDGNGDGVYDSSQTIPWSTFDTYSLLQ